MTQMIADRNFMEQYKTDLVEPIAEAFHNASENDPHIQSIIENVDKAWEAKMKFYTESASITSNLTQIVLPQTAIRQSNGGILQLNALGSLPDPLPSTIEQALRVLVLITSPVEFSTNGTLVNGDLKFTTPGGTEVEDTITGQVDLSPGHE